MGKKVGRGALVSAQTATGDYPNALVDSLITRADVAGHVKTSREPDTLGKCINPATGEPVSARRDDTAVRPVAGTRTGSADGNGRGTCPCCGAHVALSSKGYVTGHSVRKTPLPAPPPAVRLAERQAEVTDTGARVGSPDAAMRTRDAEIRAASGTATVMIQMVTEQPDGTKKKEEVEVPATAENTRTALRQEQAKRQKPVHNAVTKKPVTRKDPVTGRQVPVMGGGPDPKRLHKLGSMLRGATGTTAVPVKGAEPGTYKVREAVTLDAPNAPEGREERARDGRSGHVATSPGPALVNGRPMSGAIPEEKDRTTKGGKPRNAIGWGGPLGRSRPDPVALVGNAEACTGKGCKVRGCAAIIGGTHGYMTCEAYRTLTKSQARRYWAHVTTNKRRTEEARVLAKRPVVRASREWPTSRSVMGGPSVVRV